MDKCLYKQSDKEIPYPRVLWVAGCGYQYALMEGYLTEVSQNANGTSSFSVRSSTLTVPAGKCFGCGGEITIAVDSTDTPDPVWVPVGAGLPKLPDGKYCVWVQCVSVRGDVFGCEYCAEEGFYCDDRGPLRKGWVDSWQYLQQPPKEIL